MRARAPHASFSCMRTSNGDAEVSATGSISSSRGIGGLDMDAPSVGIGFVPRLHNWGRGPIRSSVLGKEPLTLSHLATISNQIKCLSHCRMYVSFVDAYAIHPLVSAHHITPSWLGPRANPFFLFAQQRSWHRFLLLAVNTIVRLTILL